MEKITFQDLGTELFLLPARCEFIFGALRVRSRPLLALVPFHKLPLCFSGRLIKLFKELFIILGHSGNRTGQFPLAE
jgi:hypothetical protein